MTERPVVWSESFRVRASEIDSTGHASVLTLADWLQEVAGNHATALGWAVDQLAAQGLTWVLARLHLEVARRPAWREEVTVTTWPCGTQKLYAIRDFRIVAAGGEEVARATTGWLLVNLASRRPVRPHQEIVEIGARAPARVLPDLFARLPELASVELEHSFAVRYSDLDINQHVNNVSIQEWILEGLGPERLRSSLVQMEIEFRAEGKEGDRILSQAELSREQVATFHHRLLREHDGQELARARTVWSSAGRQIT